MPIVLTRPPIAYYSTPKVASTSIKMALYELEHGSPFVPYQDARGQWWHIHNAWLKEEPTPFTALPDGSSHFKFCVVRDPIPRFLSAFGNRVHFHNELSTDVLNSHPDGRKLNLQPDPDLDTFVDRLEEYCQVSWSIYHHVRPQADFIGGSVSYFDRVYEFSEIASVSEDLSKLAGRPLKLPHEQQRGPKFKLENLTRARLQKLLGYYERDYEVLSRFYTKPV
jgi:hypothetical protein